MTPCRAHSMLPVYLAQALSPFLAAWIWQLDGRYELLQVVLLLMAAISAAAFLLAARLRPGRIARSPAAISLT